AAVVRPAGLGAGPGAVAADHLGDARAGPGDLAGPGPGRGVAERGDGGRLHRRLPGGGGGETGDLRGAPPARVGMTKQLLAAITLSVSAAVAMAQAPAAAKPVELVLEDQFERRQDLAAYRGEVVVLVYGDRKGTDACREFGEKLHV